MSLRSFQIVVVLLLALLYPAERGLQCVDDCAPGGKYPLAHQQVQHAGDGHETGADDDQQHCDHCQCVCHVPAIAPVQRHDASTTLPSRIGTAFLLSIPTAPVSPPDHVPLA